MMSNKLKTKEMTFGIGDRPAARGTVQPIHPLHDRGVPLRIRLDEQVAGRLDAAVAANLYAVAVDLEAEAQAECMETNDFRRAYEAFAARRQPEFQGD